MLSYPFRNFRRQKIQLYLSLFGIVAIIYLLYQLTYYRNLDLQEYERVVYKKKAREYYRQLIGIQPSKADLYLKFDTFQCLTSGETITFDKLNDDYCDCEDGSDEPGTSACTFTNFDCGAKRAVSANFIPSGWVNDGICDCCDGSDEWRHNKKYPKEYRQGKLFCRLLFCRLKCLVLAVRSHI